MRRSGCDLFMWSEVDPHKTTTKSEINDEQLFIHYHINTVALFIKYTCTAGLSDTYTYLERAGIKHNRLF
jgi:hypothetical protein